jgi:LuxR family maltose regulon positive regulatory protein
VGTVKWYTGQIYGKLNVTNRTQAVARARELELLA